METETLLQDLIERTRTNANAARQLKTLSTAKLNVKADSESWSALDCIEHLNLYGDFYLPEINKRIESSNSTPNKLFKPGILGDYFAKGMLPKEKLNKMKTFKDKNPNGSKLDKSVLDRFISQQEQMLQLLELSRKVDLSKTKTSISIFKWIKLRLGDTFRVVIYHNDRHLVQAKNAVA